MVVNLKFALTTTNLLLLLLLLLLLSPATSGQNPQRSSQGPQGQKGEPGDGPVGPPGPRGEKGLSSSGDVGRGPAGTDGSDLPVDLEPLVRLVLVAEFLANSDLELPPADLQDSCPGDHYRCVDRDWETERQFVRCCQPEEELPPAEELEDQWHRPLPCPPGTRSCVLDWDEKSDAARRGCCPEDEDEEETLLPDPESDPLGCPPGDGWYPCRDDAEDSVRPVLRCCRRRSDSLPPVRVTRQAVRSLCGTDTDFYPCLRYQSDLPEVRCCEEGQDWPYAEDELFPPLAQT